MLNGKKHWLVIEGSKHGIIIAPEPRIDVILADTAAEAAAEYEKSHEEVNERLFVLPYEPKTFAVEVLVKEVTES
jgi:hypothetical protein